MTQAAYNEGILKVPGTSLYLDLTVFLIFCSTFVKGSLFKGSRCHQNHADANIIFFCLLLFICFFLLLFFCYFYVIFDTVRNLTIMTSVYSDVEKSVPNGMQSDKL